MPHAPGPVETLARLALQSDRYRDDVDFREAVDNVLGKPVYDAAPALLAACEAAFHLLHNGNWTPAEFAGVREQLKAAIDLAEPKT